MNTKILFFALIAISLFSCKKKNSNPSLEQLQQQVFDAYKTATSAELFRQSYYKPYTIESGFNGNIKTLLSYDSLKTSRQYQAYNQAGYLLVDSTYRNNSILTEEINYDNSNFVVLLLRKQFSNNVITNGDSTLCTIKNGENVAVENWAWNNVDNIWNANNKNVFTYAGKGKIATDTLFSWNGNKWEYEAVIVNTYKNGNITQTTTSPITAAVNVTAPETQSTYEYDTQGNIIVKRVWINNGNTLVLENTYYNVITYW